MWGPGPCWWVYPVIGLLICFLFVVVVVRTLVSDCRMCWGSHQHDREETIRLRREIKALREQVKRQVAAQ